MKRTTGLRGLTTDSIIFLLVFFVTDGDSFSAQVPSLRVVLTDPSRDISRSILEGLRSSPPTLTAKLDLETDFYDASTGLCSEGVWHNCLVGVASLELGQHDEASQIAQSIWKYSWDGTSFRRRSWSGNWDHSTLMENSNDDDNSVPHQADYYRESAEHRCVQHGMALCFWSRLARATNDESIRAQQRQIADMFFHEFWNQDTHKWTTVSQSQGGGGLLRPSASANKRTLGATEDMVYYRVVDQAIAVLACLEHMQVLQENQDENGFASVRDKVQQTCHKGILEDFGYQRLDAARTYIHLDRNRNFWHEGWTVLALVQAREYIWPDEDDHGASRLEALQQGVSARYEHLTEGESDGTIWHWAAADKEPSYNVRYCGDNALAFCIRRKLGRLSDEGGFWSFIETLRKDNEKGLSSVADAYPQVRLHPNTELAALVLWP